MFTKHGLRQRFLTGVRQLSWTVWTQPKGPPAYSEQTMGKTDPPLMWVAPQFYQSTLTFTEVDRFTLRLYGSLVCEFVTRTLLTCLWLE